MATDTELEATATDETTETERDEALPADLTEGGKAAIVKEREARKQAAKEARELKAELDRLKAEKDEADRIKREADETEAVKRGEFEKLATERAETITAIAGERDAIKTRLDQALTLLASQVDERWKDVPEEVAELYEGDADDPLAKTAFIEKNAKLIARIKGTQDATEEKYRRASNTKTPTPDHSGKPTTEQEREALARTGQYSPF